ncbi:OmpA family protein [Nocardiopsis sp. JB363]|uniref:OmpA family protein n=1 Tax=Nocardiopsis sp. JB363 TaxID=1434837 RepID=UPI000979C7BC|nr:OmpA family protein [Nocardiopsis sp. JB363]SIO85774.1 OprF [Nocardiopsis sp. JB363]
MPPTPHSQPSARATTGRDDGSRTGGARFLATTALVAIAALALSSCGIVRDIQGEDPEQAEPTTEEQAAEEQSGEEDPRPEVEADFPYTREGRIFQESGQDSTLRFAITGLERTDEYTVLYYDNTFVDHFQGIDSSLSMPNTLIDPVSGQAFWALTDEEGYAFGSVPPDDGVFPVRVDATNQYRSYFPRLPEEVEQITFVGSGLGAMTGIPVVDVDEEQPDPADPNGADMTVADGPDAGETVEFENQRPEPGWEEYVGEMESFVDSEVASTTRDGDTETVALKSDVMFDFDSAELTSDAEEVVREAAATLRSNIDPDDPEVTVIGHTDGTGSDDYNQDLSVERAETVRDILEGEADDLSFSVEGRGADEPVAEEGGSDTEEAEARNRRVEFSYRVDRSSEENGEGGEGGGEDGALGSSERHVHPPAAFVEDDTTEIVESVTDDDVQLDVHPLRRDGAYVISTVTLTNNGDEPVLPDMGGEDAVSPGGPADFSQGALGGFQLLEPDTDLVRYVTQLNFGMEESYAGFAEEVHEMQPDNQYQLIAVFPAPSAEVEELTLRAGPFGEIEGVYFAE